MTEQRHEVTLSEPQRTVLDCRQSTILEMAGKGSGKSATIALSSGLFVSQVPQAVGFIGANTEMQLSQSTLDRVFKAWKVIFDFYEYDANHPGGSYVVDKKPPDHFVQFRKLRTYHATICFKNGAIIFIGSLENYMAHDGKEFAWGHLDETKDTREEALTEVIIGRLRQFGLWYSSDGGILFDDELTAEEAKQEGLTAWNPLYIHTAPAFFGVEWLNKMFSLSSFEREIKQKVLREEQDYFYKEFGNKAVVIYSTYHNQHNLPPNYIENQKANLIDEDSILKHIYGYPFTKSGGEFYPLFRRSETVKRVPYDPNNGISNQSWDFNVVPYMTMICAQVEYVPRHIDPAGNKHLEPGIGFIETEVMQIRIYREYCLESPRNSSEAVAAQFADEHPVGSVEVFLHGDATGMNRIEGLGNLNQYDLIEKYLQGYLFNQSLCVPSTNMGVLARRPLINKILGGKIPQVELLIDESCVHLIEDLEGVKLGPKGKDKKRTKDKETGVSFEKWGHPTDALDYLLCHLCGQYVE